MLNNRYFAILSTFSLFALLLVDAAEGQILANAVEAPTQDGFRTVALEGEGGIEGESGLVFDSFFNGSLPVLNDQGQTAFAGGVLSELDDFGFTTQRVFSEQNGSLGIVAGNSKSFADFSNVQIDAEGQVAFVQGSNVANNSEIVQQRGESLEVVASAGGPAPDTIGGSFDSIFGMELSSQGQVVFLATIAGPGNAAGIFSQSESGDLSLIARDGDIVRNPADGITLGSFNTPVVNDSGSIAFNALVQPSGAREGIFSNARNGVSEAVVLSGDPVLGTTDNVIDFDPDIVLNNLGQIAFRGVLNTTNPSVVERAVLTSNIDGDVTLVARQNDAVPNVGDGVNFDSFAGPSFNDNGVTAFSAAFSGTGIDFTNDRGIFINDEQGLRLLVQDGEAIPEIGNGATFASFGVAGLNENGQLLFTSALRTDDDAFATSTEGIFVLDENGDLHTIAFTGGLLDVSDDPALQDFRTIVDLNPFQGSVDADFGRAFNSSGQVAFGATFSDGSSGLFVSAPIVAVPEPNSLAILIAVSCSALAFRRRR